MNNDSNQITKIKNRIVKGRRRFRELMDFTPCGFLLLDGKGVIETVNTVTVMLTHFPASNLAGKEVSWLFNSELDGAKYVESLIAKCNEFGCELPVLTHTGDLLRALVVVKPFSIIGTPQHLLAFLPLSEMDVIDVPQKYGGTSLCRKFARFGKRTGLGYALFGINRQE